MMRRVVGKYLIYAPNEFGLRRNVAISAFSSVLRNPLWRYISHSLALFENVEVTFACTILVCTVNSKNRSVAIMHSNNADIVSTCSITDGRPDSAMSETRLLSIVKTFDTAYCSVLQFLYLNDCNTSRTLYDFKPCSPLLQRKYSFSNTIQGISSYYKPTTKTWLCSYCNSADLLRLWD